MDDFAMLTSNEQLPKTVLHILQVFLHNLLNGKGYNFQEHFIKVLWNSLWTSKIPGGPLVVQVHLRCVTLRCLFSHQSNS